MSDSAIPCSEGCIGFRPVVGDPWSNYGVCRLPRSPRHGYPVLLGSDCRLFAPRPSPSDEKALPAQEPLANCAKTDSLEE